MHYTYNNVNKSLTISSEFEIITYKGNTAFEKYREFLKQYDEEEEGYKKAEKLILNNQL